jgi:hypothetical protein
MCVHSPGTMQELRFAPSRCSYSYARLPPGRAVDPENRSRRWLVAQENTVRQM